MSLRETFPRLGLPTSHYFFSLSRGDSIRTLAMRPAFLWGLAALLTLSLAWGAASAVYLACHEQLVGALIARQAHMQSDYQDRLNDVQARLDEATSRRLVEHTLFDAKMRELLTRQARLEQRGSLVAALAAEAETRGSSTPGQRQAAAEVTAPDALGAIEALGPAAAAGGIDDAAARAYAPASGFTSEPRSARPPPLGEPLAKFSDLNDDPEAHARARMTAASGDPGLDPTQRLGLISHSLDRTEDRQMTTLAAIDRLASRSSARDAAIVAETGLDPAKLSAQHDAGGVGGPYIPVDADPKAPEFDKAVARVSRDVALAERLKSLMRFMPVRKPLAGDADITSPFGYRVDPFLGRPALHSGVDLIQAYGAEIHSTAAGRVIHVGLMGGYGLMVEIDHGNGLTTRYAHMSEALVSEGEDVRQGAVVGRIGSSGRSTGPHLHYEVRIDGDPVDPERFLRAGVQLTEAE